MVSPKDDKDKSYLQAYKSVLNSKANEESLVSTSTSTYFIELIDHL